MNSEENPSLPANFYNFQLNTQVKDWGKVEEQYCCSFVFHFFRHFFSFSLASPRLVYSKDSQVMSVFLILYLYQYSFKTGLLWLRLEVFFFYNFLRVSKRQMSSNNNLWSLTSGLILLSVVMFIKQPFCWSLFFVN